MKNLVMRVITDLVFVGDRPATQLWIVVTDDPKYAMEAVKERIPAAWTVEPTEYELPAEIVTRLGLASGQARMM